MRFKLLLATLTIAVSTSAMAESTDGVLDAIKAAKAAQKEFSSLGFESSRLEKILKEAEVAAKEGQGKKAIKLANQISRQISAICY